MVSFAKLLVLMGIGLVIVGGLVYLLARSGISLGRLPGDIRVQTTNMTCIFALGTSLLLSIVLTVILNIIIRLMNR
jgi:hypothetical protein